MSTQVQINDVPPKTQITATAGQTVFTTNWTANASSDVIVYARSSAQEPDDLTQEISSANYSVAFVGGSQIVEITFLVGLAAGDIVTITRNTPADRLNLYTNTNFTPSMLNQDVGILTLVDQQAQLYNEQVAPHYNVSATPDLGDSFTGTGGDIYLPVLGANQIWAKNTNNTEIIAYDVPGGGGLGPKDATYILQTPWSPGSELPNSQPLSPLATGFMSSVTSTGVVSTRTLQGTASQINVTNGTGTGNPVFSLSNTLVLPGTMTFGGNVDADGYNISNIGQANIGNIQISGNTIISTDTNGNINLTPDGAGDLVLDGLNWPQADGTLGQAVTTDGAGQLGWTSFGAPYTPSALTKVDDTNVTLTLGGTPNTALLQAVSMTLGWTGQLSIARGGTNNSVLGANGTLAQSDGTKYTFTTATYPSTATATGTILRADGTNWVATTATYPATTTINQILYSSANNVIGEITTANNGVLITSAVGVPSISSTLPTAVQGNITSVGTIGSGTWQGNTIAVGYGGTGATTIGANGTLAQSNGTIYTFTTATYPSTTTANRLLYSSATNTVTDLATANSATLVTNASGVPSWTSSMTNGQVLIGSTGATPVLATLSAGPGISIANSAGSISISGTGSGIGWTEVTGTTQAMAADNGYVSNNAVQVVFTAPVTAAFGTVINLVGKGAGGWKIAQNAGQNIQIGSTSSTVGATGYIESTNRYDSIELLCTTANTTWTVLGGPQGNITVA